MEGAGTDYTEAARERGAQQPLSCPWPPASYSLPANQLSRIQGAGAREEKLPGFSSQAEPSPQWVQAWPSPTHLCSVMSFSLHCLCYFIQYFNCAVYHVLNVLILAQIYMSLFYMTGGSRVESPIAQFTFSEEEKTTLHGMWLIYRAYSDY